MPELWEGDRSLQEIDRVLRRKVALEHGTDADEMDRDRLGRTPLLDAGVLHRVRIHDQLGRRAEGKGQEMAVPGPATR
ncbi:MAG: hypothetical protein QOK47_837 [Actinomycetota bacterium]|nr:hypothetical protein [Actinomycetota bacterium]